MYQVYPQLSNEMLNLFVSNPFKPILLLNIHQGLVTPNGSDGWKLVQT